MVSKSAAIEVHYDKNNSAYVTVGNIRVTLLKTDPNTHWSGAPECLRVQAYKDDPSVSHALHQGAELPLKSGRETFALLAGLATLLNQHSNHFDEKAGKGPD